MSIINPWVFYLIDVLSTANRMSVLLFWISLIVSVGTLFILGDRYLTEAERKTCKKVFKTALIISILSSLTCVFIPSKETMYTMIVADNVTYENVELASDVIKDSVDYIFEKLGE